MNKALTLALVIVTALAIGFVAGILVPRPAVSAEKKGLTEYERGQLIVKCYEMSPSLGIRGTKSDRDLCLDEIHKLP